MFVQIKGNVMPSSREDNNSNYFELREIMKKAIITMNIQKSPYLESQGQFQPNFAQSILKEVCIKDHTFFKREMVIKLRIIYDNLKKRL